MLIINTPIIGDNIIGKKFNKNFISDLSFKNICVKYTTTNGIIKPVKRSNIDSEKCWLNDNCFESSVLNIPWIYMLYRMYSDNIINISS